MSKTKKEKWIKMTTYRNQSTYHTKIRRSDITAVQFDVSALSSDNGGVVDIHVSDTIFAVNVRDNDELHKLLTRITGEGI